MLTGGRPLQLFADRLRRLADQSEAILDVGTPQRFAKELRPFESWFAGKRYVAAGYQPEMNYGPYNCDCHQDIEQMTFADGAFDAVICLEVLEHVQNPFRAAAELRRVLRTGGFLFLTVPFLTQYHGKGSTTQGHQGYPDFWRFTHEGLLQLFAGFSSLEVLPLDGPVEFRIKQLRLEPLLRYSPVRALVDAVDRPQAGRATSRHLLFGVK